MIIYNSAGRSIFIIGQYTAEEYTLILRGADNIIRAISATLISSNRYRSQLRVDLSTLEPGEYYCALLEGTGWTGYEGIYDLRAAVLTDAEGAAHQASDVITVEGLLMIQGEEASLRAAAGTPTYPTFHSRRVGGAAKFLAPYGMGLIFTSNDSTDVSGIDFQRCQSLFFLGDYHNIDFSEADLREVRALQFSGSTTLKALSLAGRLLPRLTDISYCFSGCDELEEVDLSGIGAEKIENAGHAFANCKALKTVDLSGILDTAANVWEDAFLGCESLQSLVAPRTIRGRFVLHYSPLLDYESIKSCLIALRASPSDASLEFANITIADPGGILAALIDECESKRNWVFGLNFEQNDYE